MRFAGSSPAAPIFSMPWSGGQGFSCASASETLRSALTRTLRYVTIPPAPKRRRIESPGSKRSWQPPCHRTWWRQPKPGEELSTWRRRPPLCWMYVDVSVTGGICRQKDKLCQALSRAKFTMWTRPKSKSFLEAVRRPAE